MSAWPLASLPGGQRARNDLEVVGIVQDGKYASFNDTLWSHQRLANRGAQGLYTQLHFTDNGQASIIYYNRHNNLVAQLTGAGKSNAPWRSAVLQSGGGRYIASASKAGDDAVTYTWFEPGPAKLRLAQA